MLNKYWLLLSSQLVSYGNCLLHGKEAERNDMKKLFCLFFHFSIFSTFIHSLDITLSTILKPLDMYLILNYTLRYLREE